MSMGKGSSVLLDAFLLCLHVTGPLPPSLLSYPSPQMASRAVGELVRKLGERVLPSIIPILSGGLKDPSSSTRQVRGMQACLEARLYRGLKPQKRKENR